MRVSPKNTDILTEFRKRSVPTVNIRPASRNMPTITNDDSRYYPLETSVQADCTHMSSFYFKPEPRQFHRVQTISTMYKFTEAKRIGSTSSDHFTEKISYKSKNNITAGRSSIMQKTSDFKEWSQSNPPSIHLSNLLSSKRTLLNKARSFQLLETSSQNSVQNKFGTRFPEKINQKSKLNRTIGTNNSKENSFAAKLSADDSFLDTSSPLINDLEERYKYELGLDLESANYSKKLPYSAQMLTTHNSSLGKFLKASNNHTSVFPNKTKSDLSRSFSNFKLGHNDSKQYNAKFSRHNNLNLEHKIDLLHKIKSDLSLAGEKSCNVSRPASKSYFKEIFQSRTTDISETDSQKEVLPFEQLPPIFSPSYNRKKTYLTEKFAIS